MTVAAGIERLGFMAPIEPRRRASIARSPEPFGDSGMGGQRGCDVRSPIAYGHRSWLRCVRSSFGYRDSLSCLMTERCAGAMNPVAPGTASVIPAQKGLRPTDTNRV